MILEKRNGRSSAIALAAITLAGFVACSGGTTDSPDPIATTQSALSGGTDGGTTHGGGGEAGIGLEHGATSRNGRESARPTPPGTNEDGGASSESSETRTPTGDVLSTGGETSESALLELDPGWDPEDLGPVAAWYFAELDDLEQQTGVSRWLDHRGSGPTLVQDVSSGQPQFDSAGWNGTQPTVRFSGGQLMTVDAWSGSPSGTNAGVTVLAVMRSAVAQDASLAAWWSPNGSSARASIRTTSGLTLLDMARTDENLAGQMYAGDQDLGTGRHVVAWRFSPSTQALTLTVDGTHSTSSPQSALSNLEQMPLIVGARSLLPTGLFQGDISELVIVADAVSDEQIQNFTEYAGNTWSGLSISTGGNPCIGAGGQSSPDGIRCDDGDPTTFGDQCLSGNCVGAVPGPGSPNELEPIAWYHAGTSEVVITDGGVSTWFDRTAGQRDLVQAFYPGRPSLAVTGWNGNKPAVTFDGGDLMRREAWTGAPMGTEREFSVLAVLRSATSQTAGIASWWNSDGYSKILAQLKASGGATFLDLLRINDANLSAEFLGDIDLGTARHVLVWRYAGGLMKLTVDGVTRTAARPDIGAMSPDTFLVGAASGLTGLFTGDISELAVIPRGISDREVANFNVYARDEWGGLTVCTPDCAGKVPGADDGCGGSCRLCENDSDCDPGHVCWRDAARHFELPGGTGVCAPPECLQDPVLGGCGSTAAPCGHCERTPRPCTADPDCTAGEVCGTDNGDAFGLAPDGDFCWPPDCNTGSTPPRCGTIDSACGICDCSANCAGRACGDPTDDGCGGHCPNLCDDGEPGCATSLDCPAGSVCGMGIGPRFGQPAGTNVCWPADCADQDPALPNRGVDPTRCGLSPPCIPECEPGDTGPDGCGGFCGECGAGEARQEDGACGPPVTFLRRSGVDLPDPLRALDTDEVGATPGAFSVTDRGHASYSVGIQVPPGRLGVQPNLALRYLSTKADGMLGVGWSLSGLSTVTRCRKFLDRDGENAAVRFNSTDRFCLDGQALFQVSEGLYGDDGVQYRTEIDSFVKVVSHGARLDANGSYKGPDWFEARTKDGRILTFGKRGRSRVKVAGGPVVRVWALNRIEDHAGNYVDVSYVQNESVRVAFGAGAEQAIDTGELLPKTMSYGGNHKATGPGSEHTRYVKFSYENRPDPTHHYVSGVQGYSVRRLTGIDTFIGGTLAKSYELTYQALDPFAAAPSQLESVRECGLSATGARRCMKPTAFEYFGEVPFGEERLVTSVANAVSHVVLDQNGDGLDDVVTPFFNGHLGFDGWLARPDPGKVNQGLPFEEDLVDFGESSGRIPCVGQDSVVDLDRDGRDDLVDLCMPRAYLADADGFVPTPINLPDTGTNRKRFADFDGDGLRDLILCEDDGGPPRISFMRNAGSDFENAIAFEPVGDPSIDMSCKDLVVIDLNGDGDDELVLARSSVTVTPPPPASSSQRDAGMRVLQLFPSGQNQFNWQWVQLGPPSLPSPTSYRMLDFNGDGLKDFLAFDGRIFKYWVNTGGQFSVQQLRAVAGSGVTATPSTFDHAIVMDRDGDGKDDLILPPLWYRLERPGVVEIRGNLGLPPAMAKGVLADIDGDGSQEIAYSLGSALRVVKSAGSGRTHLLHRVTDGLGARTTIEYDGLYDPPVDARHPEPPETRNWVRTLSASPFLCEPSPTTRCQNKVGPLVSMSSTSQVWILETGELAAPGPTLLYRYSGPVMALRGRGSLGFSERLVEAPLSRTSTTFHVDDFRLAGRPMMVARTPVSPMPSPLGDEHRSEVTIFDWGIFESGATRPYPFLRSQTHTVHEILREPGFIRRTEIDRGIPDDFGNETTRTVTTRSPQKVVDVTTTVTSPILNDPDTWIIGLPDNVVVTSERGEVRTRSIDFGYDLTRRLVTSVIRDGGQVDPPDPTQHRRTDFTPDAFGNINLTCVSVLAEETRCSRVLSRDAQNIFPTAIEDAEEMQTELIFAAEDGQLLAAIDPNGIPSERGFDAFGRLQQVRHATAEGSIGYASHGRTGTLVQDVFIHGAIAVTSKFAGEGERTSVFDAFGRLVQSLSPGFHGSVVQQDRMYDLLGRLVFATVPHAPDNTSEGFVTYHYDDVGRLEKITHPDKTATEYFYTNALAAHVSYSADFGDDGSTMSIVKLPRGNVRLTVHDATGLVSKTVEAADLSRANATSTSFIRGPFGAVAAVDAPQGVTLYGVDDWGRTQSVVDPIMGARGFTYNGFDEAVREVDMRAQGPGREAFVDVYDYDRLGRLVEKRNGVGDVIARWEFDGDPTLNEQGRLVASWRRSSPDFTNDQGTWVLNHYLGENGLPSAVEHRVHAALGDPEGGQVFTTQYVYDDQDEAPGRLTGIIYPSNGGSFRIGYDYDSTKTGDTWTGSGAIQSVFPIDEQENDGNPFWTLTAADEGYRLGEEQFGNGVVSTRTYYDPSECFEQPGVSCAGRLKDIQTSLGQAPLDTTRHRWDSNGNLAALDSLQFEYDSLDRLEREFVDTAGGQITNRRYTYDDTGRGDLMFKTGVGDYDYVPRGSFGGQELRTAGGTMVEGALVGGTTYWYDENGNQTERIGPLAKSGYQKLDYNDFDMPYHVETGTGPTPNTTDFEYTASGQRVVQRDETPSGSSTKTFIGDLYEHTVASFVPTEHRYKVLVGSRQVAEAVRGGPEDVVLYLHDDHLGSTTLITRQDGNVAETRSYEPFGGMTAQGTTGVLSSFTGHNDDAGIGLVNMRGRLYDAKIGRFVTPDPFTTNPGSSQGWNRYAYVENNPLAFTDPTGFQYCPVINDVAECGCIGTPEDCAGTPPGPSYYEAREIAQRQEDGQRRGDALSNANNGTIGTTPNGVPPAFDQPTIANPSGMPGFPNPPPTREQNWEAAKAGAWNWLIDQATGLFNIADPLAHFGTASFASLVSAVGNDMRAAAPSDPRLREQYEFMRNGLTFLSLAAAVVGSGGPRGAGLSDSTLVCRGGTCTADAFAKGSGVVTDSLGRLSGVSVNAGTRSVAELTSGLPYNQIGVTTAGEIRAAGGSMIPAPTARNPFHHTISGLTADVLEALFTPTIRNPNR